MHNERMHVKTKLATQFTFGVQVFEEFVFPGRGRAWFKDYHKNLREIQEALKAELDAGPDEVTTSIQRKIAEDTK